MPDVKVLNGLAIDASRDTLYATDSSSGTVWKVSLRTRTAALWTQGADFQPGSTSTSSLGANGVKVHDGAVWVSNTGNGTLLRVPVDKDGTAGTDTVKATGLSGIDDFAFTGRGDQVLAAQNGTNQASVVGSDGMVQTVLTAADGIENPDLGGGQGARPCTWRAGRTSRARTRICCSRGCAECGRARGRGSGTTDEVLEDA